MPNSSHPKFRQHCILLIDERLLGIQSLPLYPVRLELLRIPRPGIAQTAPSSARALAAEIGRQVFRGDLLEQFGLVVFPQDGDFGDGDFVEPGFDEGPDGGEEVGRLREGQRRWM
jgi:hypothetical protein